MKELQAEIRHVRNMRNVTPSKGNRMKPYLKDEAFRDLLPI